MGFERSMIFATAILIGAAFSLILVDRYGLYKAMSILRKVTIAALVIAIASIVARIVYHAVFGVWLP